MSHSAYTTVNHAEQCFRGLLNNSHKLNDLVEAFTSSELIDSFNDPCRNADEKTCLFFSSLSETAHAITLRQLDEIYPSAYDEIGKCAVATVVVCTLFHNELPLEFIWPINVMLSKLMQFDDTDVEIAFAVMATRTYRVMWEGKNND